jgi:hypothetical protein
MIPNMIYYSKGSDDRQFLQYPSCSEPYNTSYQVGSSANLLSVSKPIEIELPCRSDAAGSTTSYERQAFDSPVLTKNQPALPTSSYIMQKDLHDKDFCSLKSMHALRVILGSETGKQDPRSGAGASKGIPSSSPATNTAVLDIGPESDDAAGQEPSPVLPGSTALLDTNGDDEPLFGEQDLAARLDWLSN